MRRWLPIALAGLVALLVPAASALGKGFTDHPPGEVREAYERAQRALTADDTATAKREIEQVLEKAPDYAPAYGLYKDVLNASGGDARRDAAERYRKLAEANPDSAAYWYAVGRLGTDTDARRAAFEKVVALAPDAAWGHVGIGIVHEINNEIAKAVELYEKAHKIASDEPSITAMLVSAYAQAERKADAAQLLDELAKAAPGSYWTEEAFAPVVDAASGAAQLALSKRYLEMFPQGRYTVWMYTIQLDDLASKDKAAAAARAREVIAQLSAPHYAAGRGRLFETYVLALAAGQGQPAIDKLAAEVLASKETSPQVFLAIGEHYATEKADHQLGLRLLTRGFESAEATKAGAGVTDELRVRLGETYVWLGEPKRAVEYLGAVTTEEFVPTAASLLGAAEMKLGDPAKAFDAYVRAVAAEPRPERAKALAEAAHAAGRTEAETNAAVWAVRDKTAKPAAPFTLAALGGGNVSLADYRGKVVLLNFWFPG